jgi:hypothetical protein
LLEAPGQLRYGRLGRNIAAFVVRKLTQDSVLTCQEPIHRVHTARRPHGIQAFGEEEAAAVRNLQAHPEEVRTKMIVDNDSLSKLQRTKFAHKLCRSVGDSTIGGTMAPGMARW